MTRRTVVGVMGAGAGATEADLRRAERLGELIASKGWVLLTGGRPAGVMEAASRGAHRVSGSLVLGILPTEREGVSEHVDIAIFTGLGNARNVINALSSDAVVVCGVGGAGTASEAALALKAERPLVLLAPSAQAQAFFESLGRSIAVADTPERAIEHVESALAEGRG